MAKDLGATASLCTNGDVADAVAAEDRDVTHRAEEWCCALSKRVSVSASAVHHINTVDESIDAWYG